MWLENIKDGDSIFVVLVSDESLYSGDIMFKKFTSTSKKVGWQDVKERGVSYSYFPMLRVIGKGRPKISVYGDYDGETNGVIHIKRAEIKAPSEIWEEGVEGDVYIAKDKETFMKLFADTANHKSPFIRIKELRGHYSEKAYRANASYITACQLVEPLLKY